MQEINIEIKGIDITVFGTYDKGESMSYDYLGSASSFDIEKICVIDSSIDIFELFSVAEIEDIEEKVLNIIED